MKLSQIGGPLAMILRMRTRVYSQANTSKRYSLYYSNSSSIRINSCSNTRVNRYFSSKIHDENARKNVRINKALANRNVCSRREADDLIKKGWIFVNGIKAEMGMKVNDDDKIELHPSARKNIDNKLNILLYKPYVSTTHQENRFEQLRHHKIIPTHYTQILVHFSKFGKKYLEKETLRKGSVDFQKSRSKLSFI